MKHSYFKNKKYNKNLEGFKSDKVARALCRRAPLQLVGKEIKQ